MLSPRPDALLRIGSTLPCGHGGGWVRLAEEDGFELVHARVGEEEGGVVEGCTGGGWDVGVVSFFKVLDECGSDLVRGPFDVFGRSGGGGIVAFGGE